MDVHKSTPLACSTTAEQIRLQLGVYEHTISMPSLTEDQAGIRENWIRNPLDFVSRDYSEPDIYWQYCNEKLHNLHVAVFERKIACRP